MPVVAMTAVVWFYQWTVRTSGGFNAPGEEDYYNFMVRGWRQGHLYLSKEPRPEMLALADPLDPAQNAAVRMGDASYFRGHHYLYFGAAPALLLMWPYDALTGRELATTSAIFVFCTLGYVAMCATWLALRRRYFPGSAWWVAPCGVLGLGLGTHVLALARRPLVWELPIAAGFAFAMLALAAAYRALHVARPARWLALSGFFLGCAVGSRPTTVLGAVMFLPVLWQIRRTRPGEWLRSAAAAAATFGLCLAGVFAHNYARFGNPLEFGHNYVLGVVYEAKMRHFSLTYLAHNAHIYFFSAPRWSAAFPFLAAKVVPGGPPDYLAICTEAICGVAVTFPALWLALAAPAAWANRADEERERLRSFTLAAGAFAATQVAVILCFYAAMIRYAADFTPALMLLAMIGWLGAERHLQGRRRARWFAALTLAAALFTATAGVLASFDYHQQSLRGFWPDGWKRLERFFTG